MTTQERIERDLRLLIGDLQVQLLVLKAQMAELQEEQVKAAVPVPVKGKGNGTHAEAP